MGASIRTVAEEAGVSTATVSLALNDSPLVSTKTAERIRQVALRQGYVPNPHARSLARGRSGQIALIIPDIENVFYATLVHHLNDEATAAGYRLTISIANESTETERKIVREMVRSRCEAVLLTPVNKPPDNAAYMRELMQLEAPLIFTTSRYPSVDAPFVGCDLAQGMVEMMRHVRSRGCERIAFLTGEAGVMTLDDRERGYRAELPRGAEAILLRVPLLTYENAFNAALALRVEPMPDALLCVNDMMAMGAYNAFIARGLRVPEDIMVAGFDDLMYSQMCATKLSTVHQDIAGVARDTIRMALRMIEEPEGDTFEREIRLPCRLVVRDSTGGTRG